MRYSVHLINGCINGTTTEIGSYLAVRDKTEWARKQTAEKHAIDIVANPWRWPDIKRVIVEREDGTEVKSWLMGS